MGRKDAKGEWLPELILASQALVYIHALVEMEVVQPHKTTINNRKSQQTD